MRKIFCGLLIGLGLSHFAAADITYRYSTNLLNPQGRLDGYFRVSDAALADGAINAAEITIAEFTLSDVAPPFAPTVFTRDEFLPLILTHLYGEIYVERNSGQILSGGFNWFAVDSTTGQRLTLGLQGASVQLTVSDTQSVGLPGDTHLVIEGGGPGASSGGPGGGPGSEIVYAIHSRATGNALGQVDGQIVVPVTAIADGRLSASEVSRVSIAVTGTSPPFHDAVLTRSDFSAHFSTPIESGSGGSGEIRVNPVTGTILHDFYWYGSSSQLGATINLFPHRLEAWRSDPVTFIAKISAPLDIVVSGGGVTGGGASAPVAVPAMHPLAISGLASALALLALRFFRRRMH